LSRPVIEPGAVMVDLAGPELTGTDIARLRHPGVGAVILFARNYENPAQLRRLAAAIAGLRAPALPIAVDHEGGRVQRFRAGFTAIPPMRAIGTAWERDPAQGREAAWGAGFVMAHELLAHGVSLSFAPVLDLDYGRSGVIGDRAYHADPAVVGELAAQTIRGMAEAGMGSVGKHFPGHGHVAADSHLEVPVDARQLEEIMAADLLPYVPAIRAGMTGVMPAHVIYPAVDERPAGFSKTWIGILRGQFGFRGIVFSDDLSMEGARVAGGIVERGRAAFAAGCDMVLVCNAPERADELLAALPPRPLAAAGRNGLAPAGPRLRPDLRAGLYDQARRALARI